MNTVFIEGKPVATTGTDHAAVSETDMIVVGGKPPAVDYVNDARSKDVIGGPCKTVIRGKRIWTEDSVIPVSKAAPEAPAGVGETSRTWRKETKAKSTCHTVFVEGQKVIRLEDPTEQNHKNCTGKVMTGADADAIVAKRNARGSNAGTTQTAKVPEAPAKSSEASTTDEVLSGADEQGQAPLSNADEALLACILELCKTDPNVVAQLRQSTVYARDPKKLTVTTIDKKGNPVVREITSGGSHVPGTIWLNRGAQCDVVKRAAYHEVAHSRQPADMERCIKELKAYEETEKWAIKRGLPGPPSFRRKLGSMEVVNLAGIQKFLEDTYGCKFGKKDEPLPPQVDTILPDGQVKMDDGSVRPANRGDTVMQVTPGQQLNQTRIPPEMLECSKGKGKK